MTGSFFISRAHEKTRTSKSVRSLHPECSVFTNFTTWALGGILGFLWCPGQESNLHDAIVTTPSK